MKRKQILSLFLTLCLLLCSCGETGASGDGSEASSPPETGGSAAAEGLDASSLISQRDLSGEYPADNAVSILLQGSSAVTDCDAVTVEEGCITITDEGCYRLSGRLEGMLVVNAGKEDKVQLVLEGVKLHCADSAALYIHQADKVFLTLAEQSENSLSNGGSFAAAGESSIDAALFSREDLCINGSGQLSLSSPGGHGIVSKDSLILTGGSLTVSCSGHAISAKDDISIAGGSYVLNAGKDGLHAENSDDESLGILYIREGNFAIQAQGDGLSASSQLEIRGGSFEICSGGGSENAPTHSSSQSGPGGMGNGPGGMGRPGSMGGASFSPGSSGSSAAESSESSVSGKGIKAGISLLLSGGSFTLDCADDAVHSNGCLQVCGGEFRIATGDDGFHADDTLLLSGGSISVTECYEGLEALHLTVSGGSVQIKADDDGLNAAGGTDQSGMGGPRGSDRFGVGGSASGGGSITISGGELYIEAAGDGIDANGSLLISGGSIQVCGPSRGDTATLDYDTTATINGGTFIGTGASGMAQSFSDGSQGVIALQVGSAAAGTTVSLSDSQGRQLLSFAPALDFNVVILSSPQIRTGESYTVTVGSQSGSFEAR